MTYTKTYKYNKKVFERYYRGKFKYRNFVPYIVFQVLLTIPLIIPGVMFALIYWLISNPITKHFAWKKELNYNKGMISKYQFGFGKETIEIIRNHNEELTLKYNTFKKIILDKSGIYLLSKTKDFYIPMKEIENLEQIKETFNEIKNCKVKKIKQKKKNKKEMMN